MRKRFIAGATCPHCQQTDTLAMWCENAIDIIMCVKCGYQMCQSEGQNQKQEHENQQIIKIFHLT